VVVIHAGAHDGRVAGFEFVRFIVGDDAFPSP